MPGPNAPSRLSVVGITAALIVLSGCEAPAPAPAKVAAPAPPPPLTPLPAPVPAPPLSRADLLQAMDMAASAYAAGIEPAEAALTGRRFSIRQAFGCTEPAAGSERAAADGAAAWTWGAQRRSIDLTLSPADWLNSPLIAAGDGWEAAEGIWLERPWLRAEGCPAARVPAPPAATTPATATGDRAPPARAAGPAPAEAATPAPPVLQTRGLAAVFAEGSSRLGRRNGRAYSFTMRSDGDAPLAPIGGFRAVLEGRLSAFADGRAIRCHASSVNLPPVCVAAVQLDRVAFEAADGDLLREWRPG